MDELDKITIGWRHSPSIAILMYLPKLVFCNFLIVDFMANTNICAYSHKRWEPFLDPTTVDAGTTLSYAHVQTTNMDDVQNKELRAIMACGLNHIPLKQTNILKIVDKLYHAWFLITSLLKLNDMDSLNGAT